MTYRREGDIKVVGEDRMCFYCDPETLEPRTTSVYDAHAHLLPEPRELRLSEWNRRRGEMFAKAYRLGRTVTGSSSSRPDVTITATEWYENPENTRKGEE